MAAASWVPGGHRAQAVNPQAWRAASLSREPPVWLRAVQGRSWGASPPSPLPAFPTGPHVCSVGWLAAGCRGWSWGRKCRRRGLERAFKAKWKKKRKKAEEEEAGLNAGLGAAGAIPGAVGGGLLGGAGEGWLVVDSLCCSQ